LSESNKKDLIALLDNAETNLIKNMDDTAESHADAITAEFPKLDKKYIKSTFGLGVYSKRIDKHSNKDINSMTLEELKAEEKRLLGK